MNAATETLPAFDPDLAKRAIAGLVAGVLSRHYAGEFPIERVFIEIAEEYQRQTGSEPEACAKFTNAVCEMLGLGSTVYVIQ